MQASPGPWRRLNRSRFARNFLSLAKANVLAQLLLVAALPILSRFYTPAEFGVLAIFTSLLTTAESFCVWRFNQAMPNAGSLTGAAALMTSGALVLVAVSLIAALGVFVFPAPLERLESFRSLGDLAGLIPVAIFYTGLRLLLQSWFVRKSVMRHASRARIAYTVGYLAVCFLMVWAGQTASGLIVATTIALSTSCAVLLSGAGGAFLSALGRLSLRRWRVRSRASLGFTSVATLVGFVNMLSLSLTVLLLSELYDEASLGLYALLFSMVIVPARTFTSALALSFWARAAELARGGRHGQLKRLYLKVTGAMALGAAVVAAVCLASPLFLVPILGEDWVGADGVLIRMIPLIVGIVVFSPTNHLFVLGLQSLQLASDGLRIALLFAVFWIAREQAWAFETAVLAMALSSLLGHVGLFACHFIAYRIRGGDDGAGKRKGNLKGDR